MRILSVPPDVTIRFMGKDKDGNRVALREMAYGFEDFLIEVAKNVPEFRKGEDGGRSYDRFLSVIEAGPESDPSAEGEAKEQKFYRFEDSEYKALERAIKGGIEWTHPDINRAVLPYYTAFCEAQEVKTAAEGKSLRKV